jgi:capsular polysaccharide transport system permease protein
MTDRSRSEIADGLSSPFKTLAVQRRVIAALMLRELHTRSGRDKIGYLWLVAEPLTFATAIAILHHATGGQSHGDGVNPAAFGAMGYTMFILMRQIFGRAEGAIEGNASLLHHKQVTLLDICMSRFMLEGIGIVATFLIMMTVGIALGWMELPPRPEYTALALFLFFLFTSGLGLLICAGSEVSILLSRFVHPTTYLLAPLSGAFVSVAWLKESWREALYYWPFVHYFEMMRYGLFPTATDKYFDVTYAGVWGLLTVCCGMAALRVVRHHIHVS